MGPRDELGWQEMPTVGRRCPRSAGGWERSLRSPWTATGACTRPRRATVGASRREEMRRRPRPGGSWWCSGQHAAALLQTGRRELGARPHRQPAGKVCVPLGGAPIPGGRGGPGEARSMWASSWLPLPPTPVLHLLMLRKPSRRSGRRQGPRGRAREAAAAVDSVPWGLGCVREGWVRGIRGPEGVAGAWHSHAGRRGPVLTSVTSTSGQLRADSISDGIQ